MSSDGAETKDSASGDLSKAVFVGTVLDRVEPDEEAIK